MAEDRQGPGLSEVAKVNEDISQLIGGLEALAVSSEGSGDDDKNPNAADTPPTNADAEGLAIVPFGPQPPTEDCPLCFVPLPRRNGHLTYMSCCGKSFCSACYRESERVLDVKNAERAEKKLKPLPWLCPFCRTPAPTSNEEIVRRLEKRARRDDKIAIHSLAHFYRHARYGLAKDLRKSCDLLHRAADLENADAIVNLGFMHAFGAHGVSADETRGRYYLEKAVKKGHALALASLAELEGRKGRTELALTYPVSYTHLTLPTKLEV